MLIVRYRYVFFVLTSVLVGISLFAIFFFGLRFSIEFTGGSIATVSYPDGRPEKSVVENQLKGLPIGGFTIRPSGDDRFILRTRDLGNDERVSVMGVLSLGGTVRAHTDEFNSVGPVVGEELKRKALVAIGLVMLLITLFVTFVFRGVSKPVASWKYGVVVIVALIHDVLIPIGLFAFLGYALGVEVDVLFVTALLAILGYSINDTIVVFDRVRENLRLNQETGRTEEFEMTVGKSVNQTFVRSMNTSVTTALALLAIFFFGAEATQNFALALLAGVAAGTYSSIFLAAPLLVTLEKLQR